MQGYQLETQNEHWQLTPTFSNVDRLDSVPDIKQGEISLNGYSHMYEGPENISSSSKPTK
jgi:hypothetical protein